MSCSVTLTKVHVSRSKVGVDDENHLVSWRVYSHGFLFVFAVNRIACAEARAPEARAPETRRVRAPVSSRAPRDVAMPTT